jgi:phage portal protein BeeE
MRLNLGSLSGLRSAIADAIRPKAAGGSASFVQGWEALAYGSISPSATGVDVNPSSALRCAPVYAAVKVISESFAQIPLFMHARDEKGSLGRVPKHPLAELLHDMPNPQQTMFEFRLQMLMWLLTWGNAYGWIVRDHRGQVAELWRSGRNGSLSHST